MSFTDAQVDDRAKGTRTMRLLALILTPVLIVAGLVAVGGESAWAGVGSRITGLAWSDQNRDGLRTADESLRGGVTVELLSGPTGPVVQTTTTAANGTYAFTNMADGNYYVRVVAPGAFRFPDAASATNDFRRAEVPAVNAPERGIAGPFTITGSTQVSGLDAGMQPIATLVLDDITMDDGGCEGLAATGQAPWDPAPGPGLDTTHTDCIVRVGDTVQQNFSVSTDVVRTGVTIPNVVIEFTIRPVKNPNDPTDVADSRIILTGPQANGLPDGCQTGAGFSPSSSVTTAADGTMTVICNTGNATSTVTAIALMWGFHDSSPIPGFARVEAKAYTGQDDASASVTTTTGPVIEVTGRAQWEVKKRTQNGPIRAYRTVDGVSQLGFEHYYWVDVNNMLGDGGSELQWPVTLYDRMTAFPNARIIYCDDRLPWSEGNAGDWAIGCSVNTLQAKNADGSVRGWPITVNKPRTSTLESSHILVGTWVPVADAYRTIDPNWQVGMQPPGGTVAWENHITETNDWRLVGGQLNTPPGGVGPGFEAGWDGTNATGDNVVPRSFATGAPSWDLAKNLWGSPTWVDGATDNNPATPAVSGWTVQYQFDFRETGGSLITPNLDGVAIKDVMVGYPGAVLLNCINSNPNYGNATCQTGVQPADGWDMSVAEAGFSDRDKRWIWYATFFVPTPTIPDPCLANVNDRLTFRNEARETDGTMADGWLINNTGLEPGWNGTTASGNNVATWDFNVRSRVSDCGTLVGNKNFEGIPGGLNNWNQFSPGDVVNSVVNTAASNNRISVTNPILCDVFDVSVFRINGNPLVGVTGDFPNPHMEVDTTANSTLNRNDYIIEYAVGSNTVDTQSGANGRTLVNTPNVLDARGCRTYAGPWTTDPAATFGADWRDEVNMVRLRPIDPTHVQTGPFNLILNVPMQARWQYNGGPNAGEDIPAGILMNNSAIWPERNPTTGQFFYDEVSRQLTSTLPIAGTKGFTDMARTRWIDNSTVAAGTRIRSQVEMSADMPSSAFSDGGPWRGPQAPGAEDTRGFPVDNPMVCDVFDVSVFQLDNATSAFNGIDVPSDYIIEYGVGSNAVDTQAGARAGGLFPVDRSSLVADTNGCRDGDTEWETNPASFGADWQDKVNMVRIRHVDPNHTEYAGFRMFLFLELQARSVYNGGPNDGEAMLTGIRLSNGGGWSTGMRGDDWTTMQKEVRYQGMRIAVQKSAGATSYLPGATAIWNLTVGLNDARVGAVMEDVRLTDVVPTGMSYDDACTRSRLPAGATVDYNPATREVTFSLGDITATAANYWAQTVQLCTTVETIAQPGDTYVNAVTATSPSAENVATANASTRAGGTGQMGLVKSVDKPFVASGETYTWSLEWANTSSTINFSATDLIDVLPWNGDGAANAGSQRGQFASAFVGEAQLTGPLPQPTYVRGGTFAGAPAAGSNVSGTWYYSIEPPQNLNHDPRHVSNANPADPLGTWRTAGEILNFDDVTAVRFVAQGSLRAGQRVVARVPMVSLSDDLNNLYVNRAQIYSPTFPTQPLLSNEPYVQMPGFTLGDFVWQDRNGDGRFTTGEQPAAGIAIEVLDQDGNVFATTTTNAQGRWSVTKIPAGTYTVRIPAAMFQEGGPLENFVVRTVNSGSSDTPNERADNNNTATPRPDVTGLVSTPVTLSYQYENNRLVGANGPSGDDVARLAPPLIPDSFSTFTVDLALMPTPGIDIEKATNGQDADTPTGPNVTVGGAVRWTYVVTNTGGVDLTNITVTDDKVDASAIDCSGSGSNVIPGPLAPGASFTCVANGVATAGQYENLGSVTALDPTAVEVTDEDPSHYFGIQPQVDIEKSTNGQDADTPTGPNVTVGGDVRWTYVVTNTGNTPLTNVTVTDDKVAASQIHCNGGTNVVAGPLQPGASFTCVADGTATLGQYANMGTVVGTAPATTDVNGATVPGVQVTDLDPSHYFGIQPQVDIEKATNGQDADTPTGPFVAVGGDVRWTYVVTNTGNVPLTDVTVTDDIEPAGSIDCAGTDSNVVPGPLAPGESFTCIADGTATAGQYRNLGTVVGTGPETTDVDGDPVAGAEVTDEDLSHHFGATPSVDIEKATNGQDADDPTGPNVTVGGQVRWTYVVTNTGNVPLTNVTVTDDVEPAGSIDCAQTGSNVIPGPLAPGATFTCVATGTATLGQYANVGTVTGVGPETTDVNGALVPGVTVDDDDASHYFGVQPSIDIEKATNTHDADTPTGPIVGLGGGVVWTYVVTNTGNVPLTDVTVTDNVEAAAGIDCGEGSNVIAELAAGASITCRASGEAILGQYANLGSVSGVGPRTTDVDGDVVEGAVVTDEDWSHYFGVDPRIDIEKAVNGQDADEPTGPLVAIGGAVQFTYVVTNTGTTELTNVTVTDDKVDAAHIDCAGTGSNVVPGPLAAGASFTCVADDIATSGQYVNTGTVVGTGPSLTDVDGTVLPGARVTDEDLAHYFGVAPAVDIEKATNGVDADEPTGPQLVIGAAVEWTYVVTNTGNVPLTDLVVTDDVESADSIDCAGTGSNTVAGPLAPGESFTCVAHGTAIAGQYANLGTVTAVGPATTDVKGAEVAGTEVTDEDWSHYFGAPEPALTNEPPATNPPVPPISGVLAYTGGALGLTGLTAASLLLGGGLLFVFLARRRRRDDPTVE